MRFRIRKSNDGLVYSIVISGEMDDEDGWDVLQIAQTMLSMPHCKELVIDLQAAVIDEEVSVFNSDTLVSVFEEGLCSKDSAVVVRYREDDEIRMCSDQLPLEASPVFVSVSINDAKLCGKAMKWLEQEARFLAN
jgi:hypothetical protein